MAGVTLRAAVIDVYDDGKYIGQIVRDGTGWRPEGTTISYRRRLTAQNAADILAEKARAPVVPK